MAADGTVCPIERVDVRNPVFFRLLADKLVEEAQEFRDAVVNAQQDSKAQYRREKQELADIFEVLNAIMDYRKYTQEDMSLEIKGKALEKGKFTCGFVADLPSSQTK